MSQNNSFKKNISHFSAKKLCEIIVMSRYLGSMQQEAIMCMKELAKRREDGEVFDYESFIENESKKLPNFKINLKTKLQIGGLDIVNLKGIK